MENLNDCFLQRSIYFASLTFVAPFFRENQWNKVNETIEWQKIAHKGCNDRELPHSFLILQANTNRTKQKIENKTAARSKRVKTVSLRENNAILSSVSPTESKVSPMNLQRGEPREHCVWVSGFKSCQHFVSLDKKLHPTLFVSLHLGFDKIGTGYLLLGATPPMD